MKETGRIRYEGVKEEMNKHKKGREEEETREGDKEGICEEGRERWSA